MPTPFELAHLAALLRKKEVDPSKCYLDKDAFAYFSEDVQMALELWFESKLAIDREPEITANFAVLKNEVFTMSPVEWKERLKLFSRHQRSVKRLFFYNHISKEEVGKKLFRDKALNSATRQKLLEGLFVFAENRKVKCQDFDHFKSLVERAGRLPFGVCRWLAEVRQQQVTESKSRIPPKRARR